MHRRYLLRALRIVRFTGKRMVTHSLIGHHLRWFHQDRQRLPLQQQPRDSPQETGWSETRYSPTKISTFSITHPTSTKVVSAPAHPRQWRINTLLHSLSLV